jgi:hypothetical protein
VTATIFVATAAKRKAIERQPHRMRLGARPLR